MPRWMICCSLLGTLALGPGCLPPVQELSDGDTPKVSSETAEKSAAADKVETAAPEGFTKTASGLMYKVVREGGKKPTAADTVRVDYKGWLDDGTIFDQSYGKKPLEFGLGGVIPGWTEGMQLVGEGGEIELLIPSDLGYGPAGSPPVIPGNATLHFKVELHKVL